MQAKAVQSPKAERVANSAAQKQEGATGDYAQQHDPGMPGTLLRLQRSHGNRLVQRVIQPKLEVSQPGDPYEREADEVADQIMRMPDLGTTRPLQRATIPQENEEPERQFTSTLSLQKIAPPAALRDGKIEEEEENEPVQTKAFRATEPEAPNGVLPHAEEAVSAASNSTGQPLPASLQRHFEQALGADLSAVRVHTGSQSVTANNAISARAYATGSDIHFSEGQYNVQSSEGQRLLAHEVAHTVQQRGACIDAKQELHISTSGNATGDLCKSSKLQSAEHRSARISLQTGEAILRAPTIRRTFAEVPTGVDAVLAADTTVASGLAKVGTFNGPARMVQRNEEGDTKERDKAWATDIRLKVQTVQDAAQAAGEALNADADIALAALRRAQSSYSSFERAYNEAVKRFTTGVKKAMEQSEQLRKDVNTVASVALSASTGAIPTLINLGLGVVGKVEKAGALISVVQVPGGAKGEASKGGEAQKPDVSPGATTQTDWKALLQTAIDSYANYIKGNKSISAITKECLANVKWLNTVVDGKGGENVQASAEGRKAVKFDEGAGKAVALLGSIQKGSVSAGADDFAKNVSDSLDHQEAEKIEQDIAIKWLSGLSRDQVSAIDDADAYLKKIGVIDRKENRLGVDTGDWTTEWDTVVIRVRAQVEQRAKEMVGTTRKWGGGTTRGGRVVGDVRGDEQSSNWWRASGPMTLKETAGGEVKVLSYSIAPIDKDVASNWEHVHENKVMDRMIGNVTLTVEPFGESKILEIGECK